MNYQTLLSKAYREARNSHDRSTHIGALIVNPSNGSVLAGASNQFPTKQLQLDEANHERPRKYLMTEHAERGVIYKCAREGIQTAGKIMVANAACCADCARAIALAGIVLVVTHEECMQRFNNAWQESIAVGCKILESYGVAYWRWSGKINSVENLCNGEVWKP